MRSLVKIIKQAPYNYIVNYRALGVKKIWNYKDKHLRKYLISSYLYINLFCNRYSLSFRKVIFDKHKHFNAFKRKKKDIINFLNISYFFFQTNTGLKTAYLHQDIHIVKTLTEKYILVRNYNYLSNFLNNKKYYYKMYTESLKHKYYLYFNHYPNATNYNWFLWYTVSKLYKKNTFLIIKNNLNNYNLLKLSFLKFNYLFLVFYLNTFMLNDVFLNSKYRYLYVHHMFPKTDLCYFFNISNIKITLLLHILLKFNINKFF